MITNINDVNSVDVITQIDVNFSKILLLSYDRFSHNKARNLMKFSEAGDLLWVAEPTESSDAFVSIRMENGRLYANQFSGFLVELSLESGEVIEKVFTK